MTVGRVTAPTLSPQCDHGISPGVSGSEWRKKVINLNAVNKRDFY